MKKWLAVLLILTLAIGALPGAALAVAKQMRDGVPVWTRDTVEQYALDFIQLNDMDRLFGYYDLQIRRYMPMDTYCSMLTEIAWMTGNFIEFGTYASFEEPQQKTKTHILHLCMEKQDLDLYFTHKNKEDDWEVMAVEFVPAAKQETTAKGDSLVEDADSAAAYTETAVQVGVEPFLLDGILTMPSEASAQQPVPGVVLVQGSGPSDKDETIGQTKLFADLAAAFAKQGIATLRYDKRTYTYGATMTQEEIANLTVEEETIQDAISAGRMLKAHENIDPTRVILLGHSMGAMLAPRIVSEADGVFTGMVLVAGTPKTLLDIMISQNRDALTTLEGDTLTQAEAQVEAFVEQVAALKKVKTADEARQMTIAGINAYYFWEMMQTDASALIKKLKLPTYIVQGSADFQVSLEDGIEAYEDALGTKADYVQYKTFHRLNHLLMLFEGPSEDKGTVAEYNTAATLDAQAGRDLADWVLNLGRTDDEE
ncbi:MAG: alpha/beta hydrolase [Clostridiales bacterium]|nr:alpha/beta hydrolase [Clostridiales bacterium]